MMTSDSKWKLAPCPFCGGEPMAHQNPRARSLWRLQCKFCDAGPSGQLSKEQAIAAWNRRAASPQPPAPGAEVVAVLSAYYGPNGPEVSVGVIRPDDFPVVNDRVTKYPLYATPPTAEEIARRAREEALEEAAREFDKAADACSLRARFLGTGSDAWKAYVRGESENRRAAQAIRALAKPPGETGAGRL
jgi:Lar family restriction alleviation protein